MDNTGRLTLAIRWLGAALMGIALLAVVIEVLIRLEIVVLIILGAIFVAYVLYPPVRFFQARRLPRWGAILVVYLILAAIVASLIIFAGPSLAQQVKNFSTDVPKIVTALHTTLLSTHAAIISALPLEVRQSLAAYVSQLSLTLQNAAAEYAGHALSFFQSIATVVSACVIIPILAFYILLDADEIVASFIHLFPTRSQSRVTLMLQDIDYVLGGYFRGQIIVAAYVAVGVSIALLLLHVQYAFVIGVFAGIVDMIPYLGAIAGAIPAVIIAYVTHGFVRALLVVAAFTVVYQIEGHFVAPNVLGKRVGLTALLVIVAVLVAAEVGGIPAMFVAVPVAATIRMIWRRLAHPLEVSPPLQVPSDQESVESKQVVIIAKS